MSIDVTSRGQDTPDTYRGNINSVDYRRPNSSRTDSLNSSVHPTNNVEDINTFPRPEAKYPGYAQMGKRAASYRNWPQTAKQVPNNLMDAGFFYTGESFLILCMCGNTKHPRNYQHFFFSVILMEGVTENAEVV